MQPLSFLHRTSSERGKCHSQTSPLAKAEAEKPPLGGRHGVVCVDAGTSDPGADLSCVASASGRMRPIPEMPMPALVQGPGVP
jgi:hypothetical protein